MLAAFLSLIGLGCSAQEMDAVLDGMACGGVRSCPLGSRCVAGACVAAPPTCTSDLDCPGDRRCQVGPDGKKTCAPYAPGAFDPDCSGVPFRAEALRTPVVACQWPAPGESVDWSNVIMTPLVIDVDGDGQPEILFIGRTRGAPSDPSHLIALRGRDCSVLYDRPTDIEVYAHIAAGDLDGDGEIELVAPSTKDRTVEALTLYDARTGLPLTPPLVLPSVPFTFPGATPAIADLDGDGQAEIVVAGTVVAWDRAAGVLRQRFGATVELSSAGNISTVVDLDGDGRPEIITGNRILDGQSGADRTPSTLAALPPGFPAVADFNGDGVAEVVLVGSTISSLRDPMRQRLAVVDVMKDRDLFSSQPLADLWGGPPVVADFNGDGRPDIGVAGSTYYTVYSLACQGTPAPAGCQAPGILWQYRVKDASSGITGSSVFDFNGDGQAEVVYRDECWLRVFSGADGRVLFASPVTSGTLTEYPVIADVDADGHADLVVPSDQNIASPEWYCMTHDPEASTGQRFVGGTRGVLVLRDPENRWMPTRPLWNQHAYHITNIDDDGRAPRRESPNWQRYNNFRQNLQGRGLTAGRLPNLTARAVVQLEQGDCQGQQRLSAELCNRGGAPVDAAPGSFYGVDAGALRLLCTARTTNALAPGQCQTVGCDWTRPPGGASDVLFRADDDGTDALPIPQCRGLRDFVVMPQLTCKGGVVVK